jgi:hypothetical protein
MEECARLMRSRAESLCDDDYPERFLLAELVQKMKRTDVWVDDDGYYWGWRYVCAYRGPGGGLCIDIAAKYDGGGYGSVKYWDVDAAEYRTRHIV